MKDLRMKIFLSVLLIISGFTLSNYSNVSAEMKNTIAEFSTMAGVIALVVVIMRAWRGKED
jgi:hypothetical protein